MGRVCCCCAIWLNKETLRLCECNTLCARQRRRGKIRKSRRSFQFSHPLTVNSVNLDCIIFQDVWVQRREWKWRSILHFFLLFFASSAFRQKCRMKIADNFQEENRAKWHRAGSLFMLATCTFQRYLQHVKLWKGHAVVSNRNYLRDNAAECIWRSSHSQLRFQIRDKADHKTFIISWSFKLNGEVGRRLNITANRIRKSIYAHSLVERIQLFNFGRYSCFLFPFKRHFVHRNLLLRWFTDARSNDDERNFATKSPVWEEKVDFTCKCFFLFINKRSKRDFRPIDDSSPRRRVFLAESELSLSETSSRGFPTIQRAFQNCLFIARRRQNCW